MVHKSLKKVKNIIRENPDGIFFHDLLVQSGLSRAELFKVLNTLMEISDEPIQKFKSHGITYFMAKNGDDDGKS